MSLKDNNIAVFTNLDWLADEIAVGGSSYDDIVDFIIKIDMVIGDNVFSDALKARVAGIE